MKKILITGANSYIGTSFETYMAQWPEQYQVDTVDMVSGHWREKSFAGYDCVFHVAGIAHTKETADNAQLFYKINHELTEQVAQKAKAEGVRQFIFLSSMSVYGIELGPVDPWTTPHPKKNYGKSKLLAEEAITALRDETFAVAIMRPPMVYGAGCKGNYQHLEKFAKIMPFFPAYENQRSMLSIENLTKFVKDLVDNCSDGLFFPQDEEYICTCRMVQKLGKAMGRKIVLLKILNPAVSALVHFTGIGKKAFGDLYYTREQ